MAKFRSIPHEVTAVQWKGEVTPELRALFGTRPIAFLSDRGTLVVPQEGDHLAELGDWIVRTDYDEPFGGGFDLDVMEPADFSETYEPDNTPQGGLEFNIAIPAVLTGAGGEAPSDIRVRLAIGHASPKILGSIAAQLHPTMAVGCVHALCAELDPDTLVTVRDAVERIMVEKSTHH